MRVLFKVCGNCNNRVILGCLLDGVERKCKNCVTCLVRGIPVIYSNHGELKRNVSTSYCQKHFEEAMAEIVNYNGEGYEKIYT